MKNFKELHTQTLALSKTEMGRAIEIGVEQARKDDKIVFAADLARYCANAQLLKCVNILLPAFMPEAMGDMPMPKWKDEGGANE